MREAVTLRFDASQMALLDDRILEYLDEEGWATPKVLRRAIPVSVSRGHVRDRLQLLGTVELVAPVSKRRHAWDITSRGQEYLAGELDAHHLRWPKANQGAAQVFDGE